MKNKHLSGNRKRESKKSKIFKHGRQRDKRIYEYINKWKTNNRVRKHISPTMKDCVINDKLSHGNGQKKGEY